MTTTVHKASGEKPAVKSYGAILKSSSIIGGSQAITYIIGLFRTKLVAVLLGTSGVGLLGMYNAVMSISSVISTLGLQNSAVREIAAANGIAHHNLVAEIQLAVRRLTAIFGLLGAIVLAGCSPWISLWIFGGKEAVIPLVLLSTVLFFRGVNASQMAVIQGHRQIGNMARISIIVALVSTIVATPLYALYGEDGIVPALILVALVSVGISWFYVKRIWSLPDNRSWAISLRHWKRLIAIGTAVAWGALLAEAVPFFARALIVRELGFSENGIYVAAWAVSGLFANFVLTAMSIDYFPRLSALVHNREQMGHVVNEQTEIGILVALPGILSAIVFAPFIIQILYTTEFLSATELLSWFLLGAFGRVVNWPMGMIMLAKGDSYFFAITQTISVGIHILSIIICFNYFGLEGVAIAFAVQNVIYGLMMVHVLRWRYGYSWGKEVKRLLLAGTVFLLLVAVSRLFEDYSVWYYSTTVILIGLAGRLSFKGIVSRLDDNPTVQKLMKKLPEWLVKTLHLQSSRS